MKVKVFGIEYKSKAEAMEKLGITSHFADRALRQVQREICSKHGRAALESAKVELVTSVALERAVENMRYAAKGKEFNREAPIRVMGKLYNNLSELRKDYKGIDVEILMNEYTGSEQDRVRQYLQDEYDNDMCFRLYTWYREGLIEKKVHDRAKRLLKNLDPSYEELVEAVKQAFFLEKIFKQQKSKISFLSCQGDRGGKGKE